ncbi:putative chromosome partitioning protein ParB [Legionella busanensis]|uniref:Putative chromosome partitioning protein ParB n=1 Tax=Legionella busanensis TaxID=190655 RepID=A0A378KE80_9GAMM|nr:ParB N-terminal domain-containing protein [Legionella busanensis]STX81552.1 putative chromosome partitioning protein ParB [Legionella busanensis]
MSLKKKIITKSLTSNKINKPDTITRAGITANLKFTRGKQLIEQDPFILIPDPYNPRPGEVIDDQWLREKLFIGSDKSLCRILDETGEFYIPEFSQLDTEPNESIEDSYNFLRELAFSIRTDGLIEPIEIFLADRHNDPDYFTNLNLEYGYVILEGHQRRLAAMMAGVQTVTCIEITDESMLAKLKVKHRKLRRQLSENNLRKGLTVSQNFQIFQQLLSDEDVKQLKNKELSLIIGLGEGIVSALRTICSKPENYPPILFSKISDNKLTFKMIRTLAPKTYKEIESALTESNVSQKQIEKKVIKARGRQGGASKKYATFRISVQSEADSLQQFLLSRFPEIEHIEEQTSAYKNLENILNKIKEIALKKYHAPEHDTLTN